MTWIALSLATLLIHPAGAVEEKKPMTDVARGNNAFALDLYGKLRSEPGNVFVSPYSIASALAMTRAGARGETAAEMDRVLHLDPDQAATAKGFADLSRSLNAAPGQPDRGYRLDVANRLWGMQGFHFLPDFLRVTETSYGAGLERVDFAQNAKAAGIINAWVEKKTQDKIKNLIGPNDLGPQTRLVLTNAIYFKGDWASPFEANSTSPGPFRVSASESPRVPLMHQTKLYDYFEGDGLKAIRLAYKPGDLAMEAFLPDQPDGLADLEARFTAENLAKWSGALKPRRVDLTLPKWTTRARYELTPTLAALGMKSAFNPERADFSGIASEEQVSISAVVHQSFVAVDEKGTEAAAATAVMMRATSAMIVDPPAEFRADRPFLFLLRDLRSGAILFLGRVADPTK